MHECANAVKSDKQLWEKKQGWIPLWGIQPCSHYI